MTNERWTQEELYRRMGRWAGIASLLALLFYLLHDLLGAQAYPGYDWKSQAVSDLSALDAPSFPLVSGLLTVYKIFTCTACLCLLPLAQGRPKWLKTGVSLFALMQFISAIGYALFPLSSQGYDGSPLSFIHVYLLTPVVVILSILSLLLLTRHGLKEDKILGILALLSLLAMFAGAVLSQQVPPRLFGILERFSTYSAGVFTAVLGCLAWKRTR